MLKILKKYKQLLIGLVIGSTLFSSSIVFAEDRNISAFYNNIKLIINGKTIETDTEPFIISGRTMCPARFIAESLGAEVIWDETNNTVIVNSLIDDTKKYTTGTLNGLKTVNMGDDVYISLQDAIANKDKLLSMVAPIISEGVSKNMEIKSNTAVSSVTATSSTTIDIVFNSAVDKTAMENIANYAIAQKYGEKTALAVAAAQLNEVGTKVTLTTKEQTPSVLYEIGIQHIYDTVPTDLGYCGMTFVGYAQAIVSPANDIASLINSIYVDIINDKKYVAAYRIKDISDKNDKYGFKIDEFTKKYCIYLKDSGTVIETFDRAIQDGGSIGTLIDYDIWINKIAPYLKGEK